MQIASNMHPTNACPDFGRPSRRNGEKATTLCGKCRRRLLGRALGVHRGSRRGLRTILVREQFHLHQPVQLRVFAVHGLRPQVDARCLREDLREVPPRRGELVDLPLPLLPLDPVAPDLDVPLEHEPVQLDPGVVPSNPEDPRDAKLSHLYGGDPVLVMAAGVVQVQNNLAADGKFVQNKSPRVRYSRGSI